MILQSYFAVKYSELQVLYLLDILCVLIIVLSNYIAKFPVL